MLRGAREGAGDPPGDRHTMILLFIISVVATTTTTTTTTSTIIIRLWINFLMSTQT